MRERIAILGMGQSGRAVASLAQSNGVDFVGFDEDPNSGFRVLSPNELSDFDAVVISPGFSKIHLWRKWALESGKPCYGELGYASWYWRGQLIGVTGTNGKTSVTQLLAACFQAQGISVLATGNIGFPLADAVCAQENDSEAIAICEISSFQAEFSEGIEMDALLWTNFAPDHLDRYQSLSEYFEAKWQLIKCLKPGALFVCSKDVVAACKEFGKTLPDTTIVADSLETADWLQGTAFERQPQIENLQLVYSYWHQSEYVFSALKEGVQRFELPAHRLQRVENKHFAGAVFWNDSKATNFHAVRGALDAMTDAPVFWIGGGQDKGEPLTDLARLLKGRVEHAFVYGETAPMLFETFINEGIEVESCNSLENAVHRASEAAMAAAPAMATPFTSARTSLPIQVLFSPGFASFDQFKSYSERGKIFINEVLSLKARGRE